MKKFGYEKLSHDADLVIEQIKTNINGKHIYDNVYAIPRGGVWFGGLVAKALELEQVDTEEEVGPFTLVVDDLVDNGKTRQKFWDQDFATLYRKPGSTV